MQIREKLRQLEDNNGDLEMDMQILKRKKNFWMNSCVENHFIKKNQVEVIHQLQVEKQSILEKNHKLLLFAKKFDTQAMTFQVLRNCLLYLTQQQGSSNTPQLSSYLSSLESN